MVDAVFQVRHSLPKPPKQNLNLFSTQDYSSFPAEFSFGCKIATHADLVFILMLKASYHTSKSWVLTLALLSVLYILI